jgi:carboxyl-terminal processing protease
MENEPTDFTQSLETKHKITKRRQVVLCVILLILAYRVGYTSGQKGFEFNPKAFKIVNKNDTTQEVDYNLLWNTLKVVDSKFIEKHPNQETILYGAIKGAVASYGDPYTAFFEPKELTSFKTDLAGSFDGIGAEIGKKDGNIVIVAPLDDMPAQKAGILAKDILLEVNGESVVNWSVEEVVSKIRGPKGTKVKIKIFREGKTTPLDFEIVRQKIEIKSVKLEFKELNNKKIAVVKINRFGDDTLGLMQKAVNDILAGGVNGMVLDLRNNPGGYLTTAVDVSSFWVENGLTVVSEEKANTEPQKHLASGSNRLAKIPTVVLINGGSASASEILAGALQDYRLAKLVGEKSFGKGSVQELIDLQNGTAVKVTVAKWITPNGKNLNKEGLHPDVEIKLTDEDIKAEKDPQMEQAIKEIIK